ncbi:MAG TPA: CPBP family intramembrane glutamic endopeptidase [Anaerolineales bacterium]|nr:CPBP family intramembrane glutamic endopeptidase [Anaerolineales bacterium]
MSITLEKKQPNTTQGNDPLALLQENNQYNIWQILTIWLTGSALMWIMGWVIYPALSRDLSVVEAGLLRIRLLTVGLIWQFLLSMIILYMEKGNLRLTTIRRRFWLNTPISPKTGQKDRRLWWLILPLLMLMVVLELGLDPILNGTWIKLFPFLAEPPGYSPAILFAPELRSLWLGAWDLLALQVVLSVFNTFLGEEFLFHGVLLPKMNGVFGKWDWAANGILFGLYHLHQPWGLPGNIVSGLLLAFVAKRYRSNWFPILLHSGQSVYFIFLILGLVLGLA